MRTAGVGRRLRAGPDVALGRGRGQVFRCRHLLDLAAEDATKILTTGRSAASPMPLEAVPLTQELLEDWRTRTRLGQREYRCAARKAPLGSVAG